MKLPIPISHLPPPESRVHPLVGFALYTFSAVIVFAAIGASLYIVLH